MPYRPALLYLIVLLLSLPLAAQSTEGLASYYADRYHNKSTSTGEKYDKDGFMAASKEYPYGTILEVTNAVSGEQVRVRVNDCGPHHPDRVLDLSRAAARKIGVVRAGVALVKIRVVSLGTEGPTCHRSAWKKAQRRAAGRVAGATTAVRPPSPTVDPKKNAGKRPAKIPAPAPAPQTYARDTTPPAPPPAPSNQVASAPADEMLFGVQVGAFGKDANARAMAEKLAAEGFENVRAVRVGKVTRVFAGQFYFPNEAEGYKQELRKRGYRDATVRRVQ